MKPRSKIKVDSEKQPAITLESNFLGHPVTANGLAFLTGLLLGNLHCRRLHLRPEPNRFAMFVAELFTTDIQGEIGVLRLASRIQKALATLTPIGTWVASIYAGIKALLGDIG